MPGGVLSERTHSTMAAGGDKQRNRPAPGSTPPGSTDMRIAAAERRREALRLRQRGMTYEQISEQMGWDRRNMTRAVKTELRKIAGEPAQDVLDLELSRLDAIVNALWPKVLKGNLGAADRLLKVMDRRARYLGLDHVPGGDRDASDVDRWLRGITGGTIGNTTPEPTDPAEDDDPDD